ncbi:MAG TPA: ABC transporter permease [Sediminispirochaeta sp.]|nr:ABC transporter permease [Sediminispirochaeta sp.]
MQLMFEKRKSLSRKAIVLVPVVSFLVSLLLSGILLAIFGANPMRTFAAMFNGAFGSWSNFTETLVKAIPLMLTGLGVTIAFRLRFWNIGAEGQLVLGGVAATWVALFWSPFIPDFLLLPTVILFGSLVGGLWAGLPAYLKTKLGVDETLVTLMLNYVAILFAEGLYYGAWRDPQGYGFPGTREFPQAAWLPRFSGRAHVGLFVAIAIGLILWLVLNRSKWGFELNMIGKNQRAAQCMGVNVKRNIVLALLLSGALAGMAGAFEVTAISHRLQQGLAMGYGYTAIIVAWLSQLNPIAGLFVAVLMAALLVGGDQVQMMMGLPAAMGLVMQGMILFPMLAGSLFTEYRIKRIDKQEHAE